MNHPLRPQQLEVLRQLVGPIVLSEDQPAVERAWRDYQHGMDQLRNDAQQAGWVPAQEGIEHA